MKSRSTDRAPITKFRIERQGRFIVLSIITDRGVQLIHLSDEDATTLAALLSAYVEN